MTSYTVAKAVRFGVVGLGTTMLNFVTFKAMIAQGIHYLAATTVGWIAGLFISFLANRLWTFSVVGTVRVREVGSFVVCYVLQYIFGTATMYAMVDGLHLNLSVAYFLNVTVTSLLSYTLLDKVVFELRSAPIASIRQNSLTSIVHD